ncbi:hypothetical protein [Synechocystis sp. LKSZ1]|uniref:hypothetical protein n=1 Tax=Synechocystis sp. LKSZ1 TaxID=3144951 RepID=UPI00336BC89E
MLTFSHHWHSSSPSLGMMEKGINVTPFGPLAGSPPGEAPCLHCLVHLNVP